MKKYLSLLATALLLAVSFQATAHEGHDHAAEAGATTTPTQHLPTEGHGCAMMHDSKTSAMKEHSCTSCDHDALAQRVQQLEQRLEKLEKTSKPTAD